MSLDKGPKVRILSDRESLSTLEIWRQNVIYHLGLNAEFKPYLADTVTWGKKSKANPNRNLQNDTVGDMNVRKTAAEKSVIVDLLLSQIANFCPLIPRNDIVKDCADLNAVWQRVRLFYNLQTTGAFLNECWNITREPDESPQALYARLKSCYDDNLLQRDGLNHIDGKLTEEEELSPTLHNTIILHWLEKIHPKLRDLVTVRFATELRNNTYAALFPEISRSLDGLLAELNEDASACRAYTPYNTTRRGGFTPRDKRTTYHNRGNQPNNHANNHKSCDYCRIMGKRAFHTHNIDECLFLKKSRSVTCDQDSDDISSHYEEYYEQECSKSEEIVEHVLNRVAVYASPVLILHRNGKPYKVTLDSGATCNLIEISDAEQMKCDIRPTNQRVRMADGKSSLDVLGETDVEFHRNQKVFKLNALVCRSTGTNILAGMSFLKENDIAIRPAADEIIIDGSDVVKYDPLRNHDERKCRFVSTYTIQAPAKNIILPGQSISLVLPPAIKCETEVAVEPRLDSSFNKMQDKESNTWPNPSIYKVNDGIISFMNNTTDPVSIKKNEMICNILPRKECELSQSQYDSHTNPTISSKVNKLDLYSKSVTLNSDGVLCAEDESSAKKILSTYDSVFNPTISKYNGRYGNVFVEVNMGRNLPPQNKGKRPPYYSSTNLKDLQEKFDELKEKGVFARPQDIGIVVENINPSFLVKKPSGGMRLVTDFGSIASYCRPTPSIMPDVNTTLRKIAGWKYLIKSDLTEAYFQIPLKRSSMRYCGVATPGKGLLVYTAGCMGLPGVEVALEELTCLIFGDMVLDGKVAKVADDIYIGGSTPKDLLENFEEVLSRLQECNIRLSARKTVIAPKSTTILGWIWCSGRISASPHRLCTLAQADPPTTISSMRSFLGAYRVLSRVMKGYAVLLAPLEASIKGKTSGSEKIIWSEELTTAFKTAQKALSNAKAITLPIPSDILWIVTDAAVRPSAIGATLYIVRNGKTLVAEFFNSKLPPFQQKWLPCEHESLAISSALNHWAPYIIESEHRPHILTDSKPCVQAAEKLSRGEFSTSARLSTFLSSVSRYNATLNHISGHSNLVSDFSSRHPLNCTSDSCQVCSFLKKSSESVVCNLSTEDVLKGNIPLPFTNRLAWRDIQLENPDIRQTITHKNQGTQPHRKAKNMKLVRRYMASKAMVSHDGLLVIRSTEPLSQPREKIVVPIPVIHGLLMVLHLKLNHPTAHQLLKVFNRYFFALNSKEHIDILTKSCHQCAALMKVPAAMIPQSTDPPPASVGIKYAADILKRCKQKILVLRESVTSYSLAEIINQETATDISASIIKMCAILRPSNLTSIVIRVDPASPHKSLLQNANNASLKAKKINLELGRTFNKNKNPVAESAIEELLREIKIVSPEKRPITQVELATAIASLNSRIRSPGVSSHELWTHRDQVTGEQIPINDLDIIKQQQVRRKSNHPYSQKSKAPGKLPRIPAKVRVGSLVYLYSEKDKEAARYRYIVTEIHDNMCKIRRFTSHLLGKGTYDVKFDEIYSVPFTKNLQQRHSYTESSSSDDSSPDCESSQETTVSHSDESSSPDEETEDEAIAPQELVTAPRPVRARQPPKRFEDFVALEDSD